MRLTETQRQAITDAIHADDPDAPVYLFGSRADDRARGGDIDLLVLSSRIDLMAKLDILLACIARSATRKSTSSSSLISPDPSPVSPSRRGYGYEPGQAAAAAAGIGRL